MKQKVTEHERIPNLTGGKREMGWIMPRCSCGWEGKKHYAHNDWQHYNAREEFDTHVKRERASA